MVSRINPNDVLEVIEDAKDYYAKLPNLIKKSSQKTVFVGDLHGDIEAYAKIKNFLGKVKDAVVVFLGDYVDRGPYSLEIITDLLKEVAKREKRIITLRGNHETYPINDYYGFRYELLRKLGDRGEIIYKEFNELFSLFPIACLINEEILALHGGIPRPVPQLADFEKIPKGDIEATNNLLFQILWNDPDENADDWEESPRGSEIYLFGKKPFEEFMAKNKLKLLVRAHLFLRNGYKVFFEDRLISIFSTLNYVDYQIDGKILLIENDSVEILRIANL